ncbi:hypothetical protein MFRU_005g02330 [Monilinia fructicola]|nr:hypothetical protein MFRU_005g02330 [Monilinia fructicola]
MVIFQENLGNALFYIYIPISGVMRIDQSYHKYTILPYLLQLMILTTSLPATVQRKYYGVNHQSSGSQDIHLE